jgi:anti-sigma factor RsiW
MNGHLTDELAQSLVDGILPAATRDGCEAHLEGCAECQLLVESYRALDAALDDLDAPLPPPDFTDVVMARIDAGERVRAWERRLAIGIVGVAACVATVVLVLAGAAAWSPLISRFSDAVGRTATALSVGADVLSPLVRALRLQIAVGCTALGLPLLYALSRLVPRHATARA